MKHNLLYGLLLASLPWPAHAASFYIQEQGVSGLGTAYAGATAHTEDASTVYYNPAGMTELRSQESYIGINFIMPSSKFKNMGSTVNSGAATGNAFVIMQGSNSDNPFDPTPVPHIFFSTPLNEDLTVGFALTAPFGLSNEFDDDFVGRYNSTQSMLRVIDLAPSLAWKVNDWLSIGGGIDVQFVNANLQNAIPSPVTAGGPTVATDGETRLKGDDITTGFNIGLQVKPLPDTKVGLHFRQGISHTLEGSLTSRIPINVPVSGGTYVHVAGAAELDLPNIIATGISHKINDRLTLLGNVNWYEWSTFDDIPVSTPLGFTSTEQGYKNTWGFALGGRYALNQNLILKSGFQFDKTPTVDAHRSTRIPDGDRTWLTAGASYKLNERISLDFSGAYINVSKEQIDITETNPVTNVVTRTKGTTEGDIGIISTAIKFKF